MNTAQTKSESIIKISGKLPESTETEAQRNNDDHPKEQDKSPRSNKRFLYCCCCGPIILSAICITIFVAIIIAVGYFSGSYNDRGDQPANLTPAFFLDSMPPDYTITESEETEFNNLLPQYFEEDDLENVKEMVARLKEKYPEGYFVIVTQTLNRPEDLKTLYEVTKGFYFDPTDVIVHEMVHIGGFDCGTYFIDDKCITIQDQWVLSEELFSGDNLLSYIAVQDFVDEEYLVENKHTIVVTLDEVNAYIKSVRADRVYKEYNTDPSTLARQMYYISLHLKHAKEEEIEVWNALVDNKGFAYTLMRLLVMAEAELETAKEEGFSGIDVTANLKLYEENREYLNAFFISAGVEELRDLDLTYIELQERGVDFDLETF